VIGDIDGFDEIQYQWTRNGVEIPGATGSTYELTNENFGSDIRVVASYVDGGGTTESLTSNTISVLSAPAPVTEDNDAPTENNNDENNDIEENSSDENDATEANNENEEAQQQDEIAELAGPSVTTDDEEESDEIVGPDGSGPDKPVEEFEVTDPANEINQQAFSGTDTAFATPGDINSANGAEGALGQFDPNVARIISVTQSDQLWQQLDGLRDASGNEINLEQITVGTASAATSTLIVGYVIWLRKQPNQIVKKTKTTFEQTDFGQAVKEHQTKPLFLQNFKPMKLFSPKNRIALGLTGGVLLVICVARMLGQIPDKDALTVKARAQLTESVALSGSTILLTGGGDELAHYMRAMVERNEDLLTAGVRDMNNELIIEIDDHEESWDLESDQMSSHSQMVGLIQSMGFELMVFAASASFLLFNFILGLVLKHLDPSQAVPKRVRDALDNLAEGLMILDTKENILLANESLAEVVGKPAEKLVGKKSKSINFE